MSREVWQDLSVQVSRRRPRCVLDPLLCLTRRGVALIRRLAPYVELWVTPAFLGVLDGWGLYDRKPELLTQSLSMQEHGGAYDHDEFREVLHAWIKLREHLARGHGQLFWAGDNLHESNLAPDVDDAMLQHREYLAQGLEQRLPEELRGSPLAAAFPDTVALVAALDHAVLLTLREPHQPKEQRKLLQPTICHNLGLWGLPCKRLRGDDDLVHYERSLFMHLFVEAGISSFMWSGLPLVVAHLFVPGFVGGGDEEQELLIEREPRPVKGLWEDARVFWYHLSAEDEHAAP